MPGSWPHIGILLPLNWAAEHQAITRRLDRRG
jgi:hypothetical protein